MTKQNIRHFTQLITWQKNHELALSIHKATKKFPMDEQFGLTSQLRRAAISITANIAEGYGRYHYKDKIKFYYQARGSNTELQNHIILAKDLGYLIEEDYQLLRKQVYEGYKVLNGLIRSTDKFES